MRRLGLALLLALLTLPLGPGGTPRADEPAAAKEAGGEPPETEAEEPDERRKPVLDTVYDDERVGKEASEEVDAAIGLVKNDALTAYVSAIGKRLSRHAPRYRYDYTFRVVDQEEPNAFALPGGFIFVSRGLLALTNSEDELANVIGHEIAHVAARHAAARQQVQDAMPGVVQFLSMGSLASYSRDQEKEADRLGQGIAGLAGWDPDGMARFLKNLEFTERLRLGSSRRPFFLDTHPATRQRVAVAAQRAKVIAWKPQPGLAKTDQDYLRRLDGLVVGLSAAEGIFRGERFIQPDMGFTLRFPAGWETRNTHSAVGASSPDRSAQVVLEHAGRGDSADLEKALEAFAKKTEPSGLKIEDAGRVKLRGSDALVAHARVSSRFGGLDVLLTFLADQGSVYRITGISRDDKDKNQTLFMGVARSFSRVSPEMLTGIKEDRLRVVEARAGESLADLSTRTGNTWPLNRVAVMNDLFATDQLEAGQLVKVAIAQPYRMDR